MAVTVIAKVKAEQGMATIWVSAFKEILPDTRVYEANISIELIQTRMTSVCYSRLSSGKLELNTKIISPGEQKLEPCPKSWNKSMAHQIFDTSILQIPSPSRFLEM